MSIIFKISITILLLNSVWSCDTTNNEKWYSATGHWIAIDSNKYNIDVYVFRRNKSTIFEISDKERGFQYSISSTYNSQHQKYVLSNIPLENKEARTFGKVQLIEDTMLIEIDNQLVKFIKKDISIY